MSRYIWPWSLADVQALRQASPFGMINTPVLHRAMPNQSIALKCENLQLTGSFKYRGATALLHYLRAKGGDRWDRILRYGVASSSTGNFGRALAAVAHSLSLNCRIYLHESVPPSKIQALKMVNSSVDTVKISYAAWRETMISGTGIDENWTFLSAETDAYAHLGYATIAHEIVEQIPDVCHVLVPYGGGALALSLANTFWQLSPKIQVHAVELETGAPFSASLACGYPVRVDYKPSFVDSIGADFVIPQNFAANYHMRVNSLVVSLQSVAQAIQLLVMEDRIVAEGAGAATLAAALTYKSRFAGERICCIISGGMIEAQLLSRLLSGF